MSNSTFSVAGLYIRRRDEHIRIVYLYPQRQYWYRSYIFLLPRMISDSLQNFLTKKDGVVRITEPRKLEDAAEGCVLRLSEFFCKSKYDVSKGGCEKNL